jgi:hypothetical protein
MADLEPRIPQGVEEASERRGRRIGFGSGEEQEIDVRVRRELTSAVAANGDQREVRRPAELCFPQVEQRAVDVRRALPGHPGPVG